MTKNKKSLQSPDMQQPASLGQAIQVARTYFGMYAYELKRNGANSDFIKSVQGETNWALEVIASLQTPED